MVINMKSEDLFKEALSLFPGGVNSPVRATVKPYPFYVEKAKGPHLYTVDGSKIIDYVMAYGPLILGHSPNRVLEKISEKLKDGWIYGTPFPAEIELARKIIKHYPVDMVRFVNSGTEATITAIRLARGYTKRKYVVKFNGCYHGANDYLLVKGGSAIGEYSLPASEGIPEEAVKYTLVAEYNNIDEFINLMSKRGDEIAAVIVEPIAANMGVIIPNREFIRVLREETSERGSLLIFDEVVTGFRVKLGGATEYFKAKPDIITLGKIVGGVFPIGVIASSREIMEKMSPKGKVFNAGTFNSHPISIAAGLATITELETGDHIKKAEAVAKEIADSLTDILESKGIKGVVNQISSMLQIFIGVDEVNSRADVEKADKKKYLELATRLLKEGVFIPHSQMETWFPSSAHTDVIDETISALEKTFGLIK